MNGIEKITQRIDQDVQGEIDEILAKAKAEAAAITASYEAQAKKEAEEILARGAKNAAEREERLGSVAVLETKKLTLAAKQEMLGKAFEQALQKLNALPDEAYVALLAELAVKASSTGREQLIFSQKDRNRVGKQVVTAANEILAKKVAPKLPDQITESKAGAILEKVVTGVSAIAAGTGMLTLSEETRPMSGGFIMSDGDVEVNCAFETLVRLLRNEISGEVSKALFD